MDVLFSVRVQVRGLRKNDPREEAEFSCELPRQLIYNRNIKEVAQELLDVAISRFDWAVREMEQEGGEDE